MKNAFRKSNSSRKSLRRRQTKRNAGKKTSRKRCRDLKRTKCARNRRRKLKSSEKSRTCPGLKKR